jgi:hypothetical protein
LLVKERIRQRELIERDKERELILSGKLSMAESHWKDDPVLKLHRDLDKVQRKVSKGQQQQLQHLQQQRRLKKSRFLILYCISKITNLFKEFAKETTYFRSASKQQL